MIRELTLDDIPQLAEVYVGFWGEESDEQKMRNLFGLIKEDSAYILLGFFDDNGQLLGSVMGIVCHDLYGSCEPFMLLENMVVRQSARRAGVGKSLVEELERRALEAGCCQILLVTDKARVGARKFYESMGYPTENAGYKKKLK